MAHSLYTTNYKSSI